MQRVEFHHRGTEIQINVVMSLGFWMSSGNG
jgi:hypothetical protein